MEALQENDAYSKIKVMEQACVDGFRDGGKVYTEGEYKKERVKIALRGRVKEYAVYTVYALVVLHMLLYLYRACSALYHVQSWRIPLNVFTSFFWLALPALTWVVSTAYDEFNFYGRKMAGMYCCVLNVCFFMENALQYVATELVVPPVLKVPVTAFITQNMVVGLARALIFMLSFVPAFFFGFWLLDSISDESAKETILDFRILRHIDVRKYKEYAYDMRIVRRLDTGELHVIKEKDRSLHTVFDGTTGTGKTSSCIVTSVADDLDQKVKNETEQRRRVQKLLEGGKARIKEPFDDGAFSLDKIEPLCEEAARIMGMLNKHIRSCGITVLAPNASLADEISELAYARGMRVNRIDPVLTEDGCWKKGFIGFNPLYIPPSLSKLARNLEIVKKARTFADVMQALYEMNGKGDTYFTSLNRNITTCVTIIVLLTWPSLHSKHPAEYAGEQPTLSAIQDVINDFQRAKPYRDEYMELVMKYSDEQRGYTKESYQFVIDLIDNDLLGVGALQMQNQARGLRTIINEFLTNPLFKNVLCSDRTIDMDAMLSEGQITVVNYALELGRNDAVAFGLFFALSFNNAVLRRPPKTRIPHMYNIDELPVLLHPSLEQCFTLFRQYNVFMAVAIQTLDQMEKSETTKYLKGVLLGNCAHQFVFGRISTTEMKLYEEMGGKRKEIVEQNSVTETALSSENTSRSFSTRTSLQDVPVLEGGRMRKLNFQEVTVITVDNGSPVEPFYGKVAFLGDEKRLKRERYTVDWSRYFHTVPEEDGNAQEVPGSSLILKPILKESGSVMFLSAGSNRPKEGEGAGGVLLGSGCVDLLVGGAGTGEEMAGAAEEKGEAVAAGSGMTGPDMPEPEGGGGFEMSFSEIDEMFERKGGENGR